MGLIQSSAVYRHHPFRISIMIDLRELRYFVAIAETLHFGHAAERLHVTQLPLSRQVAALKKRSACG